MCAGIVSSFHAMGFVTEDFYWQQVISSHGEEIDQGLSTYSTDLIEHPGKKGPLSWGNLILTAQLIHYDVLSPGMYLVESSTLHSSANRKIVFS